MSRRSPVRRGRGNDLRQAHHAAFWKFVMAGQRDAVSDLFHLGCRRAEYWERRFRAVDRVLREALASDWFPDELRASLSHVRRPSGADAAFEASGDGR